MGGRITGIDSAIILSRSCVPRPALREWYRPHAAWRPLVGGLPVVQRAFIPGCAMHRPANPRRPGFIRFSLPRVIFISFCEESIMTALTFCAIKPPQAGAGKFRRQHAVFVPKSLGRAFWGGLYEGGAPPRPQVSSLADLTALKSSEISQCSRFTPSAPSAP